MRKHIITLLAVLTVLSLGAATMAAGPRGLPNRYMPRSMDGKIQLVDIPGSQTTVAAWAYRSGAQYDIAISSSDSSGQWSDPIFFGQDDGRDQIDPVLVADQYGNVYLAFSDRTQDRVMLSYRPSGRTDWTQALGVTPQGAGAESPGMLVVGERLVVAVRIGQQIQMIDLPLMSGGFTTRTINDSPDPVGYDDDSTQPPDDDDAPSTDYAPKRGKFPPPG